MQLKPSQRLYSKVYLALAQLLPHEIDSRLTNMAFLMIGIFGAHSVLTGRAGRLYSATGEEAKYCAAHGALFRQWGSPGAGLV